MTSDENSVAAEGLRFGPLGESVHLPERGELEGDRTDVAIQLVFQPKWGMA